MTVVETQWLGYSCVRPGPLCQDVEVDEGPGDPKLEVKEVILPVVGHAIEYQPSSWIHNSIFIQLDIVIGTCHTDEDHSTSNNHDKSS